MTKKLQFNTNIYLATFYQWCLAVVMLWLTRFIFIAVNSNALNVSSISELIKIACGGIAFDIVAATYFNLLFLLMRILPFGFTGSRNYLRATNIVYYICNSLMVIIQLADMVYFRFSGTRLRWSGMQEMATDTNIVGIVVGYIAEFWWVVALIALFIIALIWLYNRVVVSKFVALDKKKRIAVRITAFIIIGGMTALCLRGRIGSGNPLNIADATWHTSSPEQINAVLNSPFTLLRSIGKNATVERLTFFSNKQLQSLRCSRHTPNPHTTFTQKNLMFIIIESGGSAFIDSFNSWGSKEKDKVSGLMPFVDSLARQSLIFTNIMATGKRSNEGITALLGTFPAFEPLVFMLSPYNSHPFDSPATLLGREGYQSAFFYGCNHGSFQVDQFAEAAGFKTIFDRSKYPESRRDYDGKWGIFDGPMAKFTVEQLTSMSEPWVSAWFTISAHNPFTLPPHTDTSTYKYKDATPQRGLEYTDRALRSFFEMASKQSWFSNTIFVITGDHGNRDMADTRFDTPYIQMHVPLIVYAPGTIAPAKIDSIAGTQFDIGPTVLALMGFDKPYVSVGANLLKPGIENYGISYLNNRFMISSPEYVVITDAKCREIAEVYNTKSDPELTNPVAKPYPAHAQKMLTWAQAFLQDYTSRINTNQLAR